MSEWILWTTACVAFVMGAFYSGSETALIASNRIRLRHLAGKGNKRAKLALEFLQDPDYMLSSVLVGTNLAVTGCSTVATAIATRHYGDQGASVATIVLVPFFLVFNEIIPKGLFLYYANRAALMCIVPISVISRILHPLISAFSKTSEFLTGLLPLSDESQRFTVTAEELMFHIGDSKDAGLVAPETSDLVDKAVALTSLTVNDVVVPIENVDMVDFDSPVDDYAAAFEKSGFSRMPVFRGRRDNVVGVLSVHELMRGHDPDELRERLATPYTVGMKTPIADVLFEMRSKGRHMAVVEDAGAVIGVITLEDILERFVGAIQDEYN